MKTQYLNLKKKNVETQISLFDKWDLSKANDPSAQETQYAWQSELNNNEEILFPAPYFVTRV